jgi:hypothetical protein
VVEKTVIVKEEARDAGKGSAQGAAQDDQGADQSDDQGDDRSEDRGDALDDDFNERGADQDDVRGEDDLDDDRDDFGDDLDDQRLLEPPKAAHHTALGSFGTPAFFYLIHPSAWNWNSRKFGCSFLYSIDPSDRGNRTPPGPTHSSQHHMLWYWIKMRESG